jgi:hypothetical protein
MLSIVLATLLFNAISIDWVYVSIFKASVDVAL